MTAICFAPNPQQWPVSIRESTCDKPHDKSNSRLVGSIGARPVYKGAMMQGHFARAQYDVHHLGFIHRYVDSLTAPVEHIRVADINVIQQA